MNNEQSIPQTPQTPEAPTVPPQTPPAAPQIPTPTPKTIYTVKERVLAWLSILIGYLFCRAFTVVEKPFMGLIFTFALFAFGFVFFGREKRNLRSWFYPVSALILSTSLFFSGSEIVRLLAFSYILVAFLLYCQTGGRYAFEKYAAALYIFETVKAVFVAPFCGFISSLRAIGSNKKGKSVGKVLLLVLAGVGVAIVPTVIVGMLLSFDARYNEIMEKIFKNLWEQFGERVWSLLFGLPVGMYFFGALDTSLHGRETSFNAENCKKIEKKLKFAPALVGVIALLPLLFMYVVFIIAQVDYYRAVFSGTLPAAHTFSSFARDGFFRLCGVAVINGLVLAALRVFTKKTAKDKISLFVRIPTVVLSLVTLVLCGTAISQMLMYVSTYGLTRLRLYTLWFMGVIALVFLIAILSQFIRPLPFAAVCLAVFVLCFGALALPDTDAFIAEYNYDCYMAENDVHIDVDYCSSLGASAVPTLIKLTDNPHSDLKPTEMLTVKNAIGAFIKNGEEFKYERLDLPTIRARRACEGLDQALIDDCLDAYAHYGERYQDARTEELLG